MGGGAGGPTVSLRPASFLVAFALVLLVAPIAFAETDDSAPLAEPPSEEVGRYGFDRFVYWEIEGVVTPVLVEGPPGEQVRCQSEELPCSYLDLERLLDSGAAIPSELKLTTSELETLVAQLDALRDKLLGYENLDQMCQEGYWLASEQTPNMGIHMMHWGYMQDGFIPENPEILLVAMPGGELLSKQELAGCSREKDLSLIHI